MLASPPMSDARNKMIQALKNVVVPRLRELGFKGSFPHFRRRGPTLTDLLTFQFDRHGGGFVLELGQCETDFSIVWPTGERVPPDEITPFHLPLECRARLKERQGSGTAAWFRYDNAAPAGNVFEQTARRVLPFLDEAQRIFASFKSTYAKDR